MSKEQTFKCESCGGVFLCGWTEEEAKAEYRAKYGRDPELGHDDGHGDGIICENCNTVLEALESVLMEQKKMSTVQ